MFDKYIIGCLWVSLFVSMALGVYVIKKHYVVEERRALLDKKGVKTDAKVLRKEKNHKTSLSEVGKTNSGRTRRHTKYVLHLRYDANSEKGILSFNKALRGEKQDFDLSFDYREIVISVSESEYNRAEIGTKFPMKYLPEDLSIYESLNSDDEYYPNNRLYGGIFLFIFSGLICVSLYKYHKTGETW